MNQDTAEVPSASGNMITAKRIPNPLKMESGDAKGSLVMLFTGGGNQTSHTEKVHSMVNTFDRELWNNTASNCLQGFCIKLPPNLCASKTDPSGILSFFICRVH
ncbi:UNVERIFIED_CONTAM: hypothetical protein K2H54_021130 [Gekko kuhli]